MEPAENNQRVTDGTEPSAIERLKEELRHAHGMYLRALADFDNYRRRVEREQASAARTGKREIVLSLLEVLDSFDRALQQTQEGHSSVSEGMRVIHRKLVSVLEAQGVTPVKSLGEAFDPQL